MEIFSMLDDPFFYRPDAEGNLKLCCEVKQRNHRNKSFQYVKNWGTCIDIGANVGHWSRDFTKKFKRVIAFEPQSIFIECYKKNIDMTKVELHQLGLSNQEELTSMDPVGQEMFYTANNNIKCVTLDSMGFKFPIDYIKIDVDGYEYNVIRGAMETLTNQFGNTSKGYEQEAKYGKFSGFVSHYHVSKNKIDCAGLDIKKLLDEM